MRVAATDAPLDPAKAAPSFPDMLGTFRRSSVRQHVWAMAPTGRGSRKLSRLLENAVAMAAETAKVEAR